MTRRMNQIWRDGVVVETITFDVTWDEVRNERMQYLKQSDALMLVDRFNSLTSEQQNELTVYRQALRDVTQQETANEAYDAIPDMPEWLNDILSK